MLGVSLVQASACIGMSETFRSDTRVRREQPVPAQAHASGQQLCSTERRCVPSARGPDPTEPCRLPRLPVEPVQSDRARAEPDMARRSEQAKAQELRQGGAGCRIGAADVPRSICMRLCHGYQHPPDDSRDSADLVGHEAPCRAMFADASTRAMGVATGADMIDEVDGDGKTYRSLPMAYA